MVRVAIHQRKKINNQKLFQARLDTAKSLELTMKIKNIDKVNKLNRKFIITSSLAGRTTYTIQITNTPSCTCPDFQKNGSRVHLLFVLIVVLLVHDGSDILTSRFIGDDDVTLLIQHDHVDDKYILPKRPAATRRKLSNLQDILTHKASLCMIKRSEAQSVMVEIVKPFSLLELFVSELKVR